MSKADRKYPVKTVAVIVAVLLGVFIVIEQRNNADLAEYERCVDLALASGDDLDTCD